MGRGCVAWRGATADTQQRFQHCRLTSDWCSRGMRRDSEDVHVNLSRCSLTSLLYLVHTIQYFKREPLRPFHLIISLFLFFLPVASSSFPSFSTAQRRLMHGLLTTNTKQKRLRLELWISFGSARFQTTKPEWLSPKIKNWWWPPARSKRHSLPLK